MEFRIHIVFYGLVAAVAAVSGGQADAQVKETVFYSFLGDNDGAFPQAEVIADERGALYGTTSAGGISNSACFGSSALSSS